VLRFGDGHHRRPGSFSATLGADISLRHLLALPRLGREKAPTATGGEPPARYALYNSTISVDARIGRKG